MDKKPFVNELGKVLNMAKPNLVSCEYVSSDDGEEYVFVTCENGYQYKVNVTADNLTGIMVDVINAMQHK